MNKRIALDDQIREGLIKNKYVYSVTKHNIYFTAEFREKAFIELKSGKSMYKIFSECNLPISEPLLSRSKGIRRNIITCGKNGNFKRRYDYAIDYECNTKSEDNAYINYLLEENAFLKKISDAMKGEQKQ